MGVGELQRLYDMGSLKDKAFILLLSKKLKLEEISEFIKNRLSEEELRSIGYS